MAIKTMSTNVEINDSEVFNLEYLFGDSGQNVFICEGQENKWVDRDKYPEDSTVGKESERINLETCTSKEENESKEKIRQKIMVPIEVPQYLSKSQRKKYGKKVLWETKLKPLMREKEKVKVKQKKLEACLNNTIRSPSRKLLKRATMVSSKCTLRVAIDFSFDDLMSEKDIRKCVKQLSHCYCLNRRTANPVQLYATNFCGRSKEVMAYNIGYQNWDIHFNEENHTSVFLKNDIVYLTSDSENVLSELDDRKVYVIGALVDYNRHKGHTLRVAIEQGVSHAQLPIAQFIAMRSRQVLTVDQVFEILIHVLGGTCWKDAFLKVIPQRKRATEKCVFNNDNLQT